MTETATVRLPDLRKTKTFHSNQLVSQHTVTLESMPQTVVLFTPHNWLDVEHCNELKMQGQRLPGG